MKIRTIVSATALLCAIAWAPAFAQTAQQDLEQYVNSHPELKANPSLMNDPRYLASHPDLNHFLETHPQVDRARYGHSGAYDEQHHWHRAEWWHKNNPKWVETNHPDWNKSHPEWAEEHPVRTPEHRVGAPAYHPVGNPEYHPVGTPEHPVGATVPPHHHHHPVPNG